MDWQVIAMDRDVIARFVREDSEQLLVDETDWGLTSIEGAAAPAYQLFTENTASGDGVVVTGKRVGARDLKLEAEVMDTRNNDILRRRAVAFFRGKTNFQIHLTYMGVTRWIAGELAAFDAPSSQIDQPQGFSVYFVCPAAFWQSEDDFGQDIAGETARWGFPYMDHPRQGVLVSAYRFQRQVELDYDGDEPAWPRITLTASETVTNPKMSINGAYVRLLDTLLAGDSVTLAFDPPRVTKNGENILNRIDRTSNFSAMQMQPGINRIEFSADAGDNALHCVVRYNKQYLGV